MRGRPRGAWLDGQGPSPGGIELNDIELYMSIQLATALLALFAGLIPHVGSSGSWFYLVALRVSSNDFLRRQALDALVCVAQKGGLGLFHTSMQLANAALIVSLRWWQGLAVQRSPHGCFDEIRLKQKEG